MLSRWTSAPVWRAPALAVSVGGEIRDLATEIVADAALAIVTRKDEAALELLRHDAAHVLAEAAKELYPDIQVTIGPAIEDGFYYDFSRVEPFTPEDLESMEARMREIVDRDEAITREVWERDRAVEYFTSIGEHYKAELIAGFPTDEPITIYRQGAFVDLCRGPHLPSTGQARQGFQAAEGGRRLLAWRFSERECCSGCTAPPGATRRSSISICIGSRRRSDATIAAWGARWTCSISRKRRLAWCSGTPRGGSSTEPSKATCARVSRPRAMSR